MTTSADTGDRRAPLGWIVGALILGLALGLVLAWQVWPVQWTDTDPSDLRAEHQRTYVILVADSYSVTGDANQARERLYELVDQDTDWAAVDRLIAETADELEQQGDRAAALRVRRMRENVPLPVEASALPAETAAPEETAPSSPRWALVLVGLGLVVLVIALVIWLVTSEMRKRDQEAALASRKEQTVSPARHSVHPGGAFSLNPVPAPGGLGQDTAEPPERELPPWEEAAFMDEQEDAALALLDEDEGAVAFGLEEDQEEEGSFEAELEEELEPFAWDEEDEKPLAQRPDLALEEAWHVEESEAEPSEEDEEEMRTVALPELAAEDLALVKEESLEEAAPQAEVVPLGSFEASYRFGDDDFYHAFTIESPQHDFLGQCGIVISDVLGVAEAQLVDAFDLWLFETQGTRTVSKVLASEYAYTDDDLSAKLARKGQVLLAEQGLVVTLETESLRLIATIRDLGYRDDQAQPDSIFDYLQMDMVVEQISA